MSFDKARLPAAAEFDELANASKHPDLKKRYADMADCYRLLVRERKRLSAGGELQLEPEENSAP